MNENPIVECAHAECNFPAMARIKVRTGMANLCRMHYDRHFQVLADSANRERGLTTVDQMRAWCKEKLGTTRAPGPWWKEEIKQMERDGKSVTVAAHELAHR